MMKKLLAILFLLIMVIGFVVPGVLAAPPEAENFPTEFSVDEDLTLRIDTRAEGVLRNDAITDRAVLVSGTTHGLLGLSPDGTFTYEPAENYNGQDSFTYNVINENNEVSLSPGTVTITIEAVNDQVILNDILDSIVEKKTTAFTLSYNLNDYAQDIETTDASLIFSTINTNTNVVSCSLTGHTLNCIVQPNMEGSSVVTVNVNDAQGTSDQETFTITVQANVPEAPNAVNDAVETNKNTAKTITVLSNDNDPDGDSMSVDTVSTPSHGAAVKNTDGTITYTPTTGYVGSDSFTYTVKDNSTSQLTDTATVSITVIDPAVNIPALEKTYNDYSTDLDTFEDDYYDLKKDYERAEDRDNPDDLEDAENDLNDLADDLDKLLDNANDLVDDIEKADDSKYDTLEDHAKDMVDDIEAVLDRIERLLNPAVDSLDFYSDDGQTASTATTSRSVVINDLPADVLANLGPINQPEQPATSSISNSLILLMVGIVVVLAVIIFMVVLLMRK